MLYELPERTFLELYSPPLLGHNKTYLSPGILDVSQKDTVKFLVALKLCGPPLALNWDVFPRLSKKAACMQAKLLQSLEDLAHMVDERFVLAFTVETPIPLWSPLQLWRRP
ncbi:hypothetical protein DSO57_1022566 [Entomophthora muscae]|uniref:Uncharacterized protein n=1 Tax=Entomophthora muscae TaxID=34485 RepID=A0ACC2U1T7_9FUNG|nr:hypothetical protein DSO57_1022566 [Entomophthora muscae]